MLQRNTELRLASVQIDRSGDNAKTPALLIQTAQNVSVTGCAVTTVIPTPETPTTAVVFQDITGDCQITSNRFIGIVSFYGDPDGIPNPDMLQQLDPLVQEEPAAPR